VIGNVRAGDVALFNFEAERISPRLASRLEPHHAKVANSGLFVTLNPLKILVGEKLLSPFSNIRAVTFKLCTRAAPTTRQISPTS
jgi:hypothetical protein